MYELFAVGDDGSLGLRPVTRGSLHLQSNTFYWMGASDSPSTVFVLEVEGESFTYLTYPYNKPPLRGDRGRAHLIRRGTTKHIENLKHYIAVCRRDEAKYGGPNPVLVEAVEKYERLLAGEPVPELAEDPAGIRYGKCVVTAGEGPFARGDAWYEAERYGGVGSYEVDGVTHYEINCFQAKDVLTVINDPKLNFVSFTLDPKEDR